MASLHPLTAAFKKATGQEVQYVERTVNNGERDVTFKDFSADKTLVDLETAVKAKGLWLEIVFQNGGKTDDLQTDRVRAELVKNPKSGKYSIGSVKIG